tara:strand:- start:24 stop:365 length:342 start_codon:yes stop_codon:yes gene_type:complete
MNTFQKEINQIVKDTPNNMELGKKIRAYIMDEDSKWRIEQFNRNRMVEDQVSTIEEMDNAIEEMKDAPVTYIYESPDNGKTIFRKIAGDYDSPRVEVDKYLNPLPQQLNIFED